MKTTGLHKNATVSATVDTKKRAAAFVNWSMPLADGSFLKAAKGFPIFQDERFPNKHEDMLVALAEKHGGSVEVMLKCRVTLNSSRDLDELDLNDIQIIPAV